MEKPKNKAEVKPIEIKADETVELYGKHQLKWCFPADLVEILFNDNEAYTIEEAKRRINDFLKREVH